jgi:hypothetical protein
MADEPRKHWANWEATRALKALNEAPSEEAKIAILEKLIDATRREALADADWARIGL